MPPKHCKVYYYGGLPVKGARRKGRMHVEGDRLFFEVPAGKGSERINLEIPFPRLEKIQITRDNYYGTDTMIFNLTFRDEGNQSFTLRFAPIFLIPRRRIYYQKQWYDYLSEVVRY